MLERGCPKAIPKPKLEHSHQNAFQNLNAEKDSGGTYYSLNAFPKLFVSHATI